MSEKNPFPIESKQVPDWVLKILKSPNQVRHDAWNKGHAIGKVEGRKKAIQECIIELGLDGSDAERLREALKKPPSQEGE